ncbi:MAG: SDR family NAD(P)-dependent oxidoreductase [Desulfomonilaceae bacterium]
MKSLHVLESVPPILFVNPPINDDQTLIEEVSAAGGLGIVDHVTAGPARFQVKPGVAHGVRVRVEDLGTAASAPDVRLVVIPYEEISRLAAMSPGQLSNYPIPVGVEVGSKAHAVQAERVGATFLIARANEGPGWVSHTTGFVLFQEIKKSSRLPVLLQGGVTFRSAAGAAAAGGAGVVLDVHLLLAEGSKISEEMKTFLRSLKTPSAAVLAEEQGRPLRVYARVGTAVVRKFLKMERDALGDGEQEYLALLEDALRSLPKSLDADNALLPFSEDLVIEREALESLGSAENIVAEFLKCMDVSGREWPLREGSAICALHETRWPLVQGPMAHVSDAPQFLRAVSESGAFPFLAMGNMPEPIARSALQDAARATGGKFGVGLIGLEANRHCYEKHLSIMRDMPPRFCILAAGSVELAQTIERQGTACYLHCPSPSVLSEALKAGLRRFVFEGHESGGHIGLLSSLNLWSACLNLLSEEQKKGLDLRGVSALFAGGIGSPLGAAFIGGMAADLAAAGLQMGLQIGTAYLASREAVETGAITPTYQKLTVESDKTVVIGKTVNTRARAAHSPMTEQLIAREWERARNGVPLPVRKELYEKDNLGALRLASKGCAIDPATASSDCPVFCQLTPEQQIERGLYLMGQSVSLIDRVKSLAEINEEIIVRGQEIFESAKESTTRKADESVRIEADQPMEVRHEKEPIAVVGIGLRFPGASSPAEFWEQILAGRSGICVVPEDRWGKVEHYYDPDPKVPDKSYTKIGGFVTDFHFDPLKYRIPPAVVAKMDRTQQLAVVCAGDALEDAGLSPEKLQGRRVGVMIGNSMGGENTDRYAQRLGLPRALECLAKSLDQLPVNEDHKNKIRKAFESQYLHGLPEITEDSLPGELANVISGRVANVFNLQGPNFTVDAACASSMAALLNAVRALRDGTIDYAITGGVDAAMSPSSFIKFCKIGALSADGSRPFDASANGFVMGEGAGMMVLKRLSDAVRDKDRIYATILDLGSSSDGRGKGITAPNPAGQATALVDCYRTSGIDPRTIQLIEAHGTSTAVGDETELKVLDSFFREANLPPRSVGVGSVKSQIGHLKAAAGAAGLIKAILGLYHRVLPPTANVKTPNPCIDWESSPLFLVTAQKPWKRAKGAPRRVGVSAFGFGGTNFHAVLQEYAPELRVISGAKKKTPDKTFTPPRWPKPENMSIAGEAWVIGGADEKEFSEKASEILHSVRQENFRELALQCRRDALQGRVRCGFAAPDPETVKAKLGLVLDAIQEPAKRVILASRGIHLLPAGATKNRGAVACLFPGQGSQYPFMLRDLAERFPIVAETFSEADAVLGALGLTTVTDALFPDPSLAPESRSNMADPLKDTQILQPLILTADIAIFRLLKLMGLRPIAAAGHSLGEYAACVAAGVFTFRDALEAVSVRGREMARVSIADPGLMMSIPADARIVEEVLAKVDGYVVAANKNSPKQTVISGETQAVKKAGEIFQSMGLEGVLIPVSAAFHSGVVAPAREPFMKTLKNLPVNSPEIPVLSNVTGEFYPTGPSAGDRIRDLLGKQFAAPVEWVKSLRRLQREGATIFLECGPKRVLTNFTLDTLGKDVRAWPTNHPKKGGVLQLLETAAALMAEGVALAPEAGEEMSAPIDAQAPLSEPTVRAAAPLPVVVSGAPETAQSSDHALARLIDDEIRAIADTAEFHSYLELQGDFLRDIIKSGFKSFSNKVLPLHKTVKKVESEGFDFSPVVVSGLSAGLPHDVRFPFDKETLDDLIAGRNFIKRVPTDCQRRICEKNVERIVKGPDGEARIERVEDTDGVIKLAGFFTDEPVVDEYGIEERMERAMDVTTRLAVAAGIEALKDAGIPLVRLTRTTASGRELPESWALPPALRKETGVIFASAFPGMASLVDEVTRDAASRYGSGARSRLINFYTGLLDRITDPVERDRISQWFAEEFRELSPSNSGDLFRFNRDFLLRVMSMAHGQFAQLIKAQGPNTHVDAACAGTTQAILLARDWIRTGQASRVIVIAADDVAGQSLLPWVGSGFLAMGAATVKGNVREAALPFDERRHGLILGSAAVGLVLEKENLVKKRGLDPIVSIEAGVVANSGFHGTRLDVEHICSTMEEMIAKWEYQSGLKRTDLARNVFFMSHETYSPRRGGSSAAEIAALKKTFGDHAKKIPIANTKGFTGHTMGVGVEDVVAMRCLQKGLLPPIPNLAQPDPDFADMNLSKGGPHNAHYALRLAAGFGSQIVMALYKVVSKEENRLTDMMAHKNWLREMTGYKDPAIRIEQRTLRVVERQKEAAQTETSASSADRNDQPGHVQPQVSNQSPLPVDDVRATLLKLLSEKTGYPSEMLDTKLDLEADLGIDTVKQAEFISEVRSLYGIPRIDGLKIAEYPTIEHIIQFVISHLTPTALTVNTPATTEEPLPSLTGGSQPQGDVTKEIIALLAQKTGYPEEMLALDLDLEADLGIDTVKQAEFIAELRKKYNIPRIEGLKIADFPTINHLVRFVQENLGRQVQERPQAMEPRAGDVKPSSHLETSQDATITLYETRLEVIHVDPGIPRIEADEVVVAGGDPMTREAFIARLQKALACPVRTIESPKDLEEIQGKRLGCVNLLGLAPHIEPVSDTFELYRLLAKQCEEGPAFLVAAVSEDGAFGFEAPSSSCVEAGAICGATKAFAREYPDSLVRVMDFHPQLDAQARAERLMEALTPAFPLETAIGQHGEMRVVRLHPGQGARERQLLPDGDVILITGGARGIASACAEFLAGVRQYTFVLLGRTELSKRAEKLAQFDETQWQEEKRRLMDRLRRQGVALTPVLVERELGSLKAEAEVFKTVSRLRARGAEVVYRGVDITDSKAVSDVIQEVSELCGRIDLVIHAAGVDASKSLRAKTWEQMMRVFDVKVNGMRNILRALDTHHIAPKKIIGFGSVSGRFGNKAQVDYAAANDGLAHLLRWVDRELDIRALTIAWAPWSDIGMATRGSVEETLKSAGIDFIPPQRGAQILAEVVEVMADQTELVAAGRLGPFAEDAFGAPQDLPAIQTASHSSLTWAGQEAAIEEYKPGQYLRAKVMLDPVHPLLAHHRIDRACVLPGVGGLEIMTAAASEMGRDHKPYMVEALQFVRPIKLFKSDKLEIEVELNRMDAGEHDPMFEAQICSWMTDRHGNRIGERRVHHRARVRKAPSPSPRTEAAAVTFPRNGIFIPRSELYEVFFHGPAFRFLDHVLLDETASRVAFGFQNTAQQDSMFQTHVPAALESCFQACAAFAIETQGVMALPVGVERIDIYSPHGSPAAGRLIFKGATEDPTTGRRRFLFDGAIVDAHNQLILEAADVAMIEIPGAARFPGRVVEFIAHAHDLVASPPDKDALEAELTDQEYREYRSHRIEKRAREWLAGRLALKTAASRVLQKNAGAGVCLGDIVIRQDELGKPLAELRNGGETACCEVSLSHSNGFVAAVASERAAFRGLGIDIEKVKPRSKAWIEDYFTDDEKRAAAAAPDKWGYFTALWSLKEAALKALGIGLRMDLQDVNVHFEETRGRARVEFRNGHAQELDVDPEKIEARAEVRDGIALARVFIRN